MNGPSRWAPRMRAPGRRARAWRRQCRPWRGADRRPVPSPWSRAAPSCRGGRGTRPCGGPRPHPPCSRRHARHGRADRRSPGTMNRSSGAGPGSIARICAVQRMVPATQPTGVRMRPASVVWSICCLSAAPHLGDEIVAVAAIDRAGELDRATVREIAVAHRGHDRAAGRDAQMPRVLGVDRRRAQVLQRADGLQAPQLAARRRASSRPAPDRAGRGRRWPHARRPAARRRPGAPGRSGRPPRRCPAPGRSPPRARVRTGRARPRRSPAGGRGRACPR